MCNEYHCFICWDSIDISDKSQTKKIISPCHCISTDYKYVHIECIKNWINKKNTNTKLCKICCTPYIIQNTRESLSSILRKYWLFIYGYGLYILLSFVIGVVTWAKYMVPVTVIIITPKLENDNESINKMDNPLFDSSTTYPISVSSEPKLKLFAIVQILLILWCTGYIGYLLFTYIEKRINLPSLIGLDINNNIMSVELYDPNEKKDNEDDDKMCKATKFEKFDYQYV